MSDPTTPEPVAPSAVPPAPSPAAPSEPTRRGVGIWSFVLGLLVVLGDGAFVVLAFATVIGAVSSIGSGDGQIGGALAIFAVLGAVVYFGGFLVAAAGALLGLIALIAGRGRVLGVFGLIFSGVGLAWRILLLIGAFDGFGGLGGLGNLGGFGG